MLLHGVTGDSVNALLRGLTPGSHTITVTAAYGDDRSGHHHRESTASATSVVTVASSTGSGSASSSGGSASTGGSTSSGASTASTGLAAQIADDMGTNEGHPQGVPSSYDFYTGSFVGVGINVGSNKAALMWAAVYPGPNGVVTTNSIVDVSDPVMCILSVSGWSCTTYTANQFSGENDSEDWTNYIGSLTLGLPGDGTFTVPILAEAQCNGTSGSDKTGVCLSHFYPNQRLALNPSTLDGVVTCMSAKLSLIDPKGLDDRANADFVMEVGADSYISTTSQNDPSVRPAIAGGKFKYVRAAQRSFCMTTLTAAQLAANPPPISLTGDEP